MDDDDDMDDKNGNDMNLYDKMMKNIPYQNQLQTDQRQEDP